ncbi:MAG: tetratricopeptide repeat protein [Planctomycetota bacterium]|nr:tetratricopeptide repeat protein [Planctomycetota bacterium]
MNATHPPRRRLWLTLGLLGLAAIAVLFAWPRIHLWLTLSAARTAIAERDYDTALVHLEKALDQSPVEAEPHFLLARVFRHQGKPDPLRKSLEAAPDRIVGRRRSGNLRSVRQWIFRDVQIRRGV